MSLSPAFKQRCSEALDFTRQTLAGEPTEKEWHKFGRTVHGLFMDGPNTLSDQSRELLPVRVQDDFCNALRWLALSDKGTWPMWVEPARKQATIVREVLENVLAVGDAVENHPAETFAEVGDRFEFRGRLGEGVFADVWRAWDTTIGRDVALKIVRGSMQEMSTALLHARSLARVDSPNVVPIYEVLKVKDPESQLVVDAVVLKFLDGVTLKERLKDPIVVQDAGRLGLGLVAGLGVIHGAGMVHGDLHSENVMVVHNDAIILDILYRGSLALYTTAGRDVQLAGDVRDLGGLLHDLLRRSDVPTNRMADFAEKCRSTNNLKEVLDAFEESVTPLSSEEASAHATVAMADTDEAEQPPIHIVSPIPTELPVVTWSSTEVSFRVRQELNAQEIEAFILKAAKGRHALSNVLYALYGDASGSDGAIVRTYRDTQYMNVEDICALVFQAPLSMKVERRYATDQRVGLLDIHRFATELLEVLWLAETVAGLANNPPYSSGIEVMSIRVRLGSSDGLKLHDDHQLVEVGGNWNSAALNAPIDLERSWDWPEVLKSPMSAPNRMLALVVSSFPGTGKGPLASARSLNHENFKVVYDMYRRLWEKG